MKKGNTIVVIIIAIILAGLIAIGTVLGIKAKNNSSSPTQTSTTESIETNTEIETTEIPTVTLTIEDTITSAQDILTTAITKVTTTVKQSTTAPVVVKDDVTMPVIEDADHGKAPENTTVADKNLPKDMSITGLYYQGYNTIGLKDYIYNNDTDDDCVQRNFGYNELYDVGANLIDFSIETTRIKFNYDSKEYMLQLWKGQYISGDVGTVGGEVGLYTRKEGKVSAIGQYDCAAKDDWLNMEMSILWDEKGDGNYLAQFTRMYEPHWWITGYVDGQLKNKKDSSPLRILCRITFKAEEQASLCANAMISNGFKKVSTFNPTIKDTFKQYGKDLIFVWQDVR